MQVLKGENILCAFIILIEKKPWCIADNTEFQKQPPEVFCKKRGLQIYLKRLWHRCFLENFAKFIRILFLQNTSGWLLLEFWPLHWRRPVKSHGNDSNLGHIFFLDIRWRSFSRFQKQKYSELIQSYYHKTIQIGKLWIDA